MHEWLYKIELNSEIYIQSATNNSNETYTFMSLGRSGCAKTALKFKIWNSNRLKNIQFNVWGRL